PEAHAIRIAPHKLDFVRRLEVRLPEADIEQLEVLHPAKAIELIDPDKEREADRLLEDAGIKEKPRLRELLGHSGLDPITKETNPKDALAGFKPRWFSFIPLQVLIGVGKAMFEGGWKYGKHNYRESGVRASVYVDAAVCGHLMPWLEGQDHDENGMHHIEKAIASLMVLR